MWINGPFTGTIKGATVERWLEVEVQLYVKYKTSSTVTELTSQVLEHNYSNSIKYEIRHIEYIQNTICHSFCHCSTGSHITIVAHSRSVQIALDAAKQLEAEGVDCEVGLLATIIINQLSIQERKIE